ncbi:head-tail adaptor protein [Nocardiopsis tropica]|uniref:head-tail adaptor protein n=1 Tax=Nocardiopsis tropica TaxID=109330 RepID=UPI002E84B94E|nr:head-tail adaptor protein [Nocardiopsis tropica]
MRRGTGHLMNTSVTVWRVVLADDGGGGQTEAWAPQGEQPARLSQPTARQREVGDQENAHLTHVVYLRPGVDVRRGDQLRQPGLRLEVVAVFEPSVRGTYLRADCTSRQAEGE